MSNESLTSWDLSPINSVEAYPGLEEDGRDNINETSLVSSLNHSNKPIGSFSGAKVVNGGGGPSKAFQKGPEPKPKALNQKKKNYVGVKVKNLKDKIYRREKDDKMRRLETLFQFVNQSNNMKEAVNGQNGLAELRNADKMLEKIKEDCKLMEKQGKSQEEIAHVMKDRLEQVDKAIHNWDEISKMGVQASDQCDYFTEEIATYNDKVAIADEGQGSWRTPDFAKKSPDFAKKSFKDMADGFKTELFVNNPKKVKFSDYEGLEEALLSTRQWEIPKYLQATASKVKEACGVTEHDNILILLCAAIHDMEHHVGVEQLHWDRLLTWGAACNKAKDAGFRVEFVEEHLNKILYAFLGSNNRDDCQERVRKLKAKLKAIEECLSAERSFEGNPLSHGLFP